MGKWNDTDEPLAFLITFRCYGTWLHGDNRGSVNRFRNSYGTRRLPPNEDWLETNTERLIHAPVTLNATQRNAVKKSIEETCEIRNWNLRALNIRTNHVHAVVSIGPKKPETALNSFKANATREMRQTGCWKYAHSPWSKRGSKRYLWNEKSIALAIEYVINAQGDDLPDFD